MADIAAKIESKELLLMQAWLNRDAGMMRKLIHRDCTFMIGSTPPQLLDRPSLVAGLDGGLICKGFRMGEGLTNRYGKSVWWSCGAELQLKLGQTEWAGTFVITDLWRKFAWGGWKLAQRSMAPTAPDTEHDLAGKIRRLQLWR